MAVVQPAIESGRWVLSIDSIGNVPAPAGPGGAAGAQNGFGHMVWVCTEDAVSPMTPKASVFVPQNYALCSAGQVSGTGSRAPGGHGSFDDGDVMAIELDKDGQVQFFKNGEKFGEKVATQAPAAPAPPGTKYVLVISGTPQGGPGQPGPASECVVRLLNPREGQPQPSSEEETTAATLRPRRVRAPFVVLGLRHAPDVRDSLAARDAGGSAAPAPAADAASAGPSVPRPGRPQRQRAGHGAADGRCGRLLNSPSVPTQRPARHARFRK